MSIEKNTQQEFIKPKDFIVMGGVEVTVEDFVALWNGENILPELSRTEIDTARKEQDIHYIERHREGAGDVDDMMPLLIHTVRVLTGKMADTAFESQTQEKLQIRKRDKIRKLIKRYQESTQDRRILQMDRVLAVLSNSTMKHNEIGAFVARYSELQTTDIGIIQATIEEIQAVVPGHHKNTRYVDGHSAQSLTVSLAKKEQEFIERTLEIDFQERSIIPTVLLERALAGHEITNDEFTELTLNKNIGTAKIISVIQYTRLLVALIGATVVTITLAKLPEDEDIFNRLMALGLGLFSAGILADLIPTSAMRVKRKMLTSNQHYQEIYAKLRKKIDELKQTPAGKARIALLSELIRNIYETDAQKNIALLQPFVRALDQNPDMENEFNGTLASMDHPGNNINDIFEAIDYFKTTKDEMIDISHQTGTRIVTQGDLSIIDAEFEEDAANQQAIDEIEKERSKRRR